MQSTTNSVNEQIVARQNLKCKSRPLPIDLSIKWMELLNQTLTLSAQMRLEQIIVRRETLAHGI